MAMADELFGEPHADAPDLLDHGRMTIWEHIAELRTRLIRAIIAVSVGTIVGFIAYEPVLKFLMAPYTQVKPDAKLYATDLVAAFGVRIQMSMYLGIALAMPVILWQLWRFVTPGLYPHEKRYAVPFVGSALVLFVGGAAIAYVSLPATLTFLIDFNTDVVQEIPDVNSYIKLNLFMMLAFGIGCEFPVLLTALQLVGVLTWRQLLGWWRYALVVISVAAAVITPSGDPISMLLLAIPMWVLYFVSVVIGIVIERRKRAKATA